MKLLSLSRSPLLILLGTAAVAVVLVEAQQEDYADYGGYGEDGYGDSGYGDGYGDAGYAGQDEDNLYHDYASRQQEKEIGAGGGMGMGKLLMGSAVSWFLGGKFHSSRTAKKLKTKFQKEQKELYSQYYNDVYKLTEQNQQLNDAVKKLQDTLKELEEKHELEAIQRDYDEFKQPDIDGDDRISRAEFNMYVKNYLSNYPGLSEKDYPKFEDFDHDGDGYVSFQEYAQQMALQAQQAELEQTYGTGNSQKAEAYQNMAGGSGLYS